MSTVLKAMLFILEQGHGDVSPSSGVYLGIMWGYKKLIIASLFSKPYTTENHVLYRTESILDNIA